MMDWSWLPHAWSVARWEAWVKLGQAVWTDVLTYWWFGPLLLVLLVRTGRKKLLRLASKVPKAPARELLHVAVCRPCHVASS